MATRTRKRPGAAETEQLDFDPNAVAETAQDQEQFYDSATDPHPEDDDGIIPPDNGDEGEDDPSSAQPLGRTVVGMSQGQQAAAAELADYMRRMANLAAEKQAVADDIKELKKEIKGRGYDTKAFDLVMKLDGLSDTQKAARREQNQVNATYAHAVGIDEELL